MAGSIATAYIDVIPSFKGFKKSVNNELRGLDGDGRKHGQKLGEATAQGADKGFKGEGLGTKLASKMGKTLKAGAIGAGVAVGGVLAGSIAKGMGRLTAIDQAQAKLKGLGNSTQDVGKIMDNALASVKGTAFGLGEAATVSAQMVAAGIKPGKELETTLRTVGDTAAIAGRSMEDVGLIFGSVAARGKLQGDDMLQLMSAGVPVLQLLAKETGKTSAEVSEMVSKGEIDFATFEKAMRGGVGGAAKEMGNTFSGALANMGASMGRFGEALVKPLFDASPKLMTAVGDIFDSMTDAFKPASEKISASLGPAFEKLGETLSTKVAPFAGEAAGKIGELIASLVDKAVDPTVWEKVGTAFGQVADVARDIGPALGDLAASFATVAGAITVSTWQVFAAVLNALSPLISSVLVPLVEQVAKFAEQNPGAVQAIVTAFLGFKAVGAVAGPVKAASSAIKGLGTATSVLKGFGKAGGALGKLGKVGGVIGKVGGQLAKFAPLLGRIAKAAFTLVRSLNPIGLAITVVTTALGLFFTKTETGKRVWQGLMDKLKEAYQWIKGVFGQVFDWLGEKVKGAFDGIKNVIGGTVDWIKGAFDTVTGLVKGVFDILFKGEVPETGLFGLNDESGASFGFLFALRENAIAVKDAVVAAWDWMKIKWQEFTTFLGLVYETVVVPVWDLFMQNVQALGDFLGLVWDGIKVGWELLGQGIQIVWEAVILPAWEAVKAGAQVLWDLVKAAFDGIKTAFDLLGQGIQIAWEAVIKPVWDLFVAGAQLLWDGVKGVFSFIGSGFEAMGRLIKSTWNVVIRPVLGIMRQMFGVLQDVLTGNFDNIKNRFSAMGDHLSNVVHGVINGSMEFFKSILRGVQGAFTVFKNHAGRMVDAVKQKMTDMVNSFKRLPGQIKSVFSGAGSWLVGAGKSIIQGLINGIKSMAGAVGSAISSVIPHQLGGLIGFAGGGLLPGLASGGPLPSKPGSGLLPRIPGVPRSLRDPIMALNRGGIPIARIEPEEFIVNREDTRKNLPLLRAVNAGAEIDWAVRRPGRRAGGPQNVGGLPAYAGGGIVGAMTSLVKQKFPMLTMTSGYRSGDGGYHGRGMAADFSNGHGNTPQQLALARAIAQTYPNSAELIYDSPGWSGNIKNGKTVGAFGQFYTMAQAGPHHHHVHWAMTTAPTKPLGSGPASGGSGGSSPAPVQNLGPSKWSEKNLTVNAVRAMRALQVKFPQIKTIGGWRANDPYPDHPSGRALDIMTYNDMGLGDRIKDWLFNHDFKMQYALWRQAQWNSASAKSGMANRGSPTQNHMDHVHAYFAASPRATGNEKYTMPNGAGDGVTGAAGTGDSDGPQQKEKRTIQLDQVDYGTASQLKTEFESRDHHETQLRKYLKNRAKVYDTGGILPTGGIAVNLGKPELIFPAEATTAMLQMARKTPQFAQAMDVLSQHVPQLAASIDKWTGLDYGVISQELAAAWANEDFGYGELARAIGEEAAEKIVTKLAFIGDQIRDIQDGTNIRAYLADLRASEGIALADQVAGLVGVGGINDMFGGVAKGFESMEDAAVQQVDAAEAVTQAEKNLAKARREYAEMVAEAGGDPELSTKTSRKIEDAERKLVEARNAKTKDAAAKAKKIADAERNLARVREDASAELAKNGAKNSDELVEAAKVVTQAEQEYTTAKGVVAAASRASGQAQVAMMIEIAELAVKIVKWIDGKIHEVWASVVAARRAVGEMMKATAEFAELAAKARESVAGLRLDWAMAQIELAAAFRNVRLAQLDGMKGQLEAAKTVAEAEAAFEQARRNDLRLSMAQYDDLSLAYDRFRWNAKAAIEGNLEDMSLWSDSTMALFEELNAARVGLDLASLKAKEKELEATYKLALAALDLQDVTRDLQSASEKLAVMTGKTFGMDQVEATVMERYANLVAEKSQLQADQASIKTWINPANWGTIMPANQRRIRQIDEQLAAIELRDDFKGFDPVVKKQIDKMAANAGAMGFFGSGDKVEQMVRNSALGDAARALDAAKFESELIDSRSERAKARAKIDRGLMEIEHRNQLDPVKARIDAAEMRQASHEAMADYYRTSPDSPMVREAIKALADQQREGAARMERVAKPVVIQVPGNRTALTVDEIAGVIESINSQVDGVEMRLDVMERKSKPDALAVATARRF